MKLFGAIDLHSNNNVMVLINERDEVVYRKRLANDLTLIIVHLANTAAIQQYNGLKYTDDDSDARWLAHLLRFSSFE